MLREVRRRVAVQTLEAKQLATLRADIARAETFSLLYVPFIHAVLRSGLYGTQIAVIRSLSPQHRFNWDQMVALYRRRIEEAPDDVAATLSATNVQLVNMSFDASHPTGNPWPYIPAAIEAEARLTHGAQGPAYRWPLRGDANQRFTQEGILSQDLTSFQHLQNMFVGWQQEFLHPQ